METIYYLSTIIFLWNELLWMIQPLEKTLRTKKLNSFQKEFKGKNWDEYPENYKSEIKSRVWQIWILIWLFIGLFTFQWAGFLAFLGFNLIIIAPISKLTNFSFAYTVIHWLNSIIGFVFGVFVIVNHYHLKIDLDQFFLSLIK